jgi:sugar lactone lactonase YvrE
MPRKNNDLKDRLARYRQIKISVLGHESGRCGCDNAWRDAKARLIQWVSIALVLVVIAPNGLSSSHASRTPAIRASINGPTALALDNNGHLYVIEEEEDRIDRIDLGDGTISVVAGYGRKPEQDCLHRDGIQATKACLQYPTSLAVDASGNLFIGEMSGYLREVNLGSGLISTVNGNGHSGETVEGSSALSANFWSIDGLAIAADNDLFISDVRQGGIFKVDARTGVVTRIAGNGKQGFRGDGESALNASFRNAVTISLDNAGNLLIADSGNCRIRRVEHSTGIVRTVATTGEVSQDGSCKAGNLELSPDPSDAVADPSGNVYFVEGAMDIVRRVDSLTLSLSIAAGSGAKGFHGDGGLAVQARLNNPSGLAVDRDGNLYISEFVNNRIRRVDVKSKVITTIAGNGLPHRRDLMM